MQGGLFLKAHPEGPRGARARGEARPLTLLPAAPSALCSILETWLVKYPGDFCRAPDLASLKQLMAYILVNMPDSDIILQVCRLLARPGAH